MVSYEEIGQEHNQGRTLVDPVKVTQAAFEKTKAVLVAEKFLK